MVTAVDSSVILDVICGDSRYADASERALRHAAAAGMLIVCECVVAEVWPALDMRRFTVLMKDWHLKFVPSNEASATRAGEMFALYLSRGGQARAIVPDFLIGAHAETHADQLLARDRGFLRDYFHTLDVITPT